VAYLIASTFTTLESFGDLCATLSTSEKLLKIINLIASTDGTYCLFHFFVATAYRFVVMSNRQSDLNHREVSPLRPTETLISFPGRSSDGDLAPHPTGDPESVPENLSMHHAQSNPIAMALADEEHRTEKPIAKSPIHQISVTEDSSSGMGARKGQSWIWQISTALLSLAGLVASIILLLSIQRHPRLSDWTFSHAKLRITSNLSPNTLIAIFSAISKSAMLFAIADCIGQLKWVRFYQQPHLLRELQTYDEASRGPWGALKLIWKTKGTALLASFGAFLTIIALALDPFSQQVISHVTRPVLASNGSAVFQVANRYISNITGAGDATTGMSVTSRYMLTIRQILRTFC
jgi:hypothetical protein